MEKQHCEHTLYHRADSGDLQGSWKAEPTEHGPRVSCGECGKFYGYERQESDEVATVVEAAAPNPLDELVAPAIPPQVAAPAREEAQPPTVVVSASYDLARWHAHQQRLTKGETSIMHHIGEFEAMFACRDSFLADLKRTTNVKTMARLAGRVGVLGANRNTKAENAESVFRVLLRSFALDKSVMYSPLQGETYYTAVAKGTDVDQPRNLAKSVTVE